MATPTPRQVPTKTEEVRALQDSTAAWARELVTELNTLKAEVETLRREVTRLTSGG